MKKILITGGPVHEHLDDVKIITNRFKGGRIAGLATKIMNEGMIHPTIFRKRNNVPVPLEDVYDGRWGFELDDIEKCKYKIIYLCSKDSNFTTFPDDCMQGKLIEVVFHNGFNDYCEKVKKYAKEVDAVILGAAVCNLIPVKRIQGKFPSHNYKPEDIIPIDFKIAPRVVDMVKKENPHVNLFAFKLLNNVPHEELIDAAYDIALESKATAVIANDLKDLNTKHIVTKEKGVLEYKEDDYYKFILDCIEDEYYRTVRVDGKFKLHNVDLLEEYKLKYTDKFTKTCGKERYVFGTIATCDRKDYTITATIRGKKDLEEWVSFRVDDNSKKVLVKNLSKKPTLNAPLLNNIFKSFDKVNIIVHFHEQVDELPTLEYAIPGTVRDSLRDLTGNGCDKGFNIKGHGAFLFFE